MGRAYGLGRPFALRLLCIGGCGRRRVHPVRHQYRSGARCPGRRLFEALVLPWATGRVGSSPRSERRPQERRLRRHRNAGFGTGGGCARHRGFHRGCQTLDPRGWIMTALVIADAVYRWPTRRSRVWLEGFLDRMATDENVAAVVAVGSAVRPNVASEDLDLIVLCHDVGTLNADAPIEVDVRKLPISGLDGQIGEGHDMLTWAIRFGRPLVDKGDLWSAVVARWKDRLPLPSASVCTDRATAARKRMEEMRIIGDECATADFALAYQTHRARARLVRARVYPASRPELAGQLRMIDEVDLACDLEAAVSARGALSRGSTPTPRVGPHP